MIYVIIGSPCSMVSRSTGFVVMAEDVVNSCERMHGNIRNDSSAMRRRQLPVQGSIDI